MVTINRLQTFANALSNTSIVLKYCTDPSFTCTGLPTTAYGRPSLATAGLFIHQVAMYCSCPSVTVYRFLNLKKKFTSPFYNYAQVLPLKPLGLIVRVSSIAKITVKILIARPTNVAN